MRPSSTTRCLRAVLQSTNARCSAPAQRCYGSVSSVTSGPAIGSAIPTSIPRNSVFQQAIEATELRTNWTKKEIQQIYDTPLIELAFAAVSSPHTGAIHLRMALSRHRGGNHAETCLLHDGTGNSPQTIPQPSKHPNVYPPKHQDWRLL
jgi:hypothetical protein